MMLAGQSCIHAGLIGARWQLRRKGAPYHRKEFCVTNKTGSWITQVQTLAIHNAEVSAAGSCNLLLKYARLDIEISKWHSSAPIIGLPSSCQRCTNFN